MGTRPTDSSVIKLSSNESSLGPSPRAIAAMVLQTPALCRYPDSGQHEIRNAIGQVYGLAPEQIICGAGSDELISLLINAYAGEGDEVLYSEHGFLMYKISALAAGATPVTARETDLRTDVDALLAAVTEHTKLVFVANPNNPTGSYINHTEMQRLRNGLPEQIILVIDGAYTEYVTHEDYRSGKELVETTDNTVMLRTFSKIYGLPALRLGWGYFPPNIAEVIHRVRGPFNVSSLAMVAGVEAVIDQDYLQTVRAHNDEWLPKVGTALEELGLTVHPSVGNFLLVDFGDAQRAEAANQFLLEHGIIVRDVVAYGLAHCLRITIGLEHENQRLITTLTEFLRD